MTRFLAIGECMAELSPSATQGDFRLGFAGDTFNTAWYLARRRPDLGVSYFTKIGDDAISGQLRTALTQAGIDDSHVGVVANSTVGLYLISLADGERSFSYWRGQSAAKHLADDPAALAEACGQSDVIYFSGITLAILSPEARQTMLKVLRAARADGRTIAFDPNLRPRLWSSPAQMTDAIMEAAAVSDIALPSFEDEASWFGDRAPEATGARYAAAGVDTVIVKNGPDPVLWRDGDQSGTVPVPPLPKIVDTTAAGDSFNAGFLSDWQQGHPIEASISTACRLAAKVVQGRGALVPVEG